MGASLSKSSWGSPPPAATVAAAGAARQRCNPSGGMPLPLSPWRMPAPQGCGAEAADGCCSWRAGWGWAILCLPCRKHRQGALQAGGHSSCAVVVTRKLPARSVVPNAVGGGGGGQAAGGVVAVVASRRWNEATAHLLLQLLDPQKEPAVPMNRVPWLIAAVCAHIGEYSTTATAYRRQPLRPGAAPAGCRAADCNCGQVCGIAWTCMNTPQWGTADQFRSNLCRIQVHPSPTAGHASLSTACEVNACRPGATGG